MKYLVFGIATIGLAFLAQWFGLAALIFAIGHMWFEAFVYTVLTLASSALGAGYGALFMLECLKNHMEWLSKPDVSERIT